MKCTLQLIEVWLSELVVLQYPANSIDGEAAVTIRAKCLALLHLLCYICSNGVRLAAYWLPIIQNPGEASQHNNYLGTPCSCWCDEAIPGKPSCIADLT